MLYSLRCGALLILESELVSGFMTEHAAVIFVFFFLAEYASIVLICILTSILFLGGYLLNFTYIVHLIKEIDYYIYIIDTVLLDSLYQLDIYMSYNVLYFYPHDYISNINTEYISNINTEYETFLSDPYIEGLVYGLTLGLKTCVMIFIFI